MNDKITIAVCSIDNRILNFNFPKQKLKNFKHEVFLQGNFEEEKIPKYVKVSNINGVGVNRSRNIAIKECKTKYLYFADDDTEPDYKCIENLLHQVKRLNLDGAIYCSSVQDEYYNKRKNYPTSITRLNKFNSGKYGISEMIFDVEMLKTLGLEFDEMFGAGMKLNVGDEYLFLNSVLDKSQVYFFPLTIAQHPQESSGNSLTFNSFFSRLLILKKVFPVLYLPIFFYLSLRLISKKIYYYLT